MTKLIPILSGRCLVVELPKKAHGFKVTEKGNLTYFNYDELKGSYPSVHALPPGNWQILGMMPEVTSDDVAAITGQYYNKYNERYVHYPSASTRVTPIDDIESAIVAEGYHLDVNPIPEPHLGEGVSDDWITDYNNAQSRVLSRERCLLLRREVGWK